MARTLTDTLMVTPGAWVVGSRMEDLDPEDRCGRWLDQRVQPSQRWAARGVRVWHWRRPRPFGPAPAGRTSAPPRATAPAHKASTAPLKENTD
jgi:hypothetical protein